jgi:hypothetical protein
MARAGSIAGKGQGWKKESVRHSNARKYGKAGGKYATTISITHSEPTNKMPRYKSTQLYKFDELSKEAQAKALDRLRDINVDHDWWGQSSLFDPRPADFTRLGNDFKKEYDLATKNGYTDLNHFKIAEFDIDRYNYLQIEKPVTENPDLFLKQLGLNKWQIKKVINIGVYNGRETDSELDLEIRDDVDDVEKIEIQDQANEGFKILINRAKKDLREQYYDSLSDEQVKETIEANEYDFNEKGELE